MFWFLSTRHEHVHWAEQRTVVSFLNAPRPHLILLDVFMSTAFLSIQPRTSLGKGALDVHRKLLGAAWPHSNHTFKNIVYPAATMGFIELCLECLLPDPVDVIWVSLSLLK
jgi:hypothetical protein